MAFTSTLTDREIFGNRWKTWGTYTNSGSTTGGDIDTGLKVVENIQLTPTGSSVDASAPTVNETFTDGQFVGNKVTIVTVAGGDGLWEAVGRM